MPAADDRAGTLVLGVGNILYRDEGVGVAAAAALASRKFPGIDVLDRGTLGLSLFSEVDGRGSLLIFDAVAGSGEPPGTVAVFGPVHASSPSPAVTPVPSAAVASPQ